MSQFWKETLTIENEIKPLSLIGEQTAAVIDSKIMDFANKLTLNKLIYEQLGTVASL